MTAHWAAPRQGLPHVNILSCMDLLRASLDFLPRTALVAGGRSYR